LRSEGGPASITRGHQRTKPGLAARLSELRLRPLLEFSSPSEPLIWRRGLCWRLPFSPNLRPERRYARCRCRRSPDSRSPGRDRPCERRIPKDRTSKKATERREFFSSPLDPSGDGRSQGVLRRHDSRTKGRSPREFSPDECSESEAKRTAKGEWEIPCERELGQVRKIETRMTFVFLEGRAEFARQKMFLPQGLPGQTRQHD
jgi:hypothetical protein